MVEDESSKIPPISAEGTATSCRSHKVYFPDEPPVLLGFITLVVLIFACR